MIVSKVNTKLIYKHNNRFEGKHYLNNSSYLSLQLEKNEKQCCALSSLAEVFNPPVFKRQFCKNTPRAVPYFQSSDVQSASERSAVYIYKGQAQSLNLLVKENDILVTGFGTIGNTRLVSKFQDGVCYANNVCRIRTTEHTGFIYAFISGKYGKAQLNTNASGSVVRYIESPGIKKILVPIFSDSFQQDVDNLVQEAARLREEATCALEKAKQTLKSFINADFVKNNYKTSIVKSRNIFSSLQHRLDPPALMNDGVVAMDKISSRMSTKIIADINVKVSRPGIFKRIYVENGIPYIKGSEIFLNNPFRRCEHLSRTRTPFVDEMTLYEGQILITCAGSVGNIKMITKEYEDKKAIGSQDIIRLISNDELFTKEYLFIYLQMPFVNDYIQSMKYGSVIERIEPFHVESIPVVTPTKELSEEISAIVRQYMDCTYRAFNAEEKAIQMVEQEIEKWNKH